MNSIIIGDENGRTSSESEKEIDLPGPTTGHCAEQDNQ